MEGRPWRPFICSHQAQALPRRQISNLALVLASEQQIQRLGDHRLIGGVFFGGDHAQLAQHVWREVSADRTGAVAVSAASLCSRCGFVVGSSGRCRFSGFAGLFAATALPCPAGIF